MSNHEQYKRLVEQEDSYWVQIATVEICADAIIDYLYRCREAFDWMGVKDMLETIYEIEANMRKELLLLRLEKVMLACEMRQEERGRIEVK